jgi:hypothetical protein
MTNGGVSCRSYKGQERNPYNYEGGGNIGILNSVPLFHNEQNNSNEGIRLTNRTNPTMQAYQHYASSEPCAWGAVYRIK